MGKLVVLEGIDGCGKSTIAEALKKKLENEGLKVEIRKYPVDDGLFNDLIQQWLLEKESGEFYNLPTIQMLYELNRYADIENLNRLLNENDYVIADRYFYSNIVYGMARGLDKEFCENLTKYEIKPDYVFMIDVFVEVAYERRKVKDRMEKDMDFQNMVRNRYLLYFIEHGLNIIRGDRPVDLIVDEIYSKIY